MARSSEIGYLRVTTPPCSSDFRCGRMAELSKKSKEGEQPKNEAGSKELCITMR